MKCSCPYLLPEPHPCRRQLLGFQFFSKFVLFILLLNPLSQKWGLILPNPECPAFPLLNLVSCAVPSGTWAGEDIAPVWVFINVLLKFKPPACEINHVSDLISKY